MKIPENLDFSSLLIQISRIRKPTSANLKNQQTKNQRFHVYITYYLKHFKIRIFRYFQNIWSL